MIAWIYALSRAVRGVSEEPAQDEWRRPGRRAWAGLLLTCLVVFGVPVLLLRGGATEPFAEDRVAALQAADPEYVFIGNSMLQSRIDPAYLGRLLGGARVESLALPGSQSAIWYLQLKNLVAASQVAPRVVFIFFRDDLITRPLERTDGQNRALIDSLSAGDEREFSDAITGSRDTEEWIEAALERVYPVQLRQADALDLVSRAAAAPLKATRAELSQRADDLFTFSNFRDSARQLDVPDAVRPFGEAVGSSFLPRMLDVARENGLKLVFVRVQAKPIADGSARQSEALARYSSDLAAYLAEKGVAYHDFTGDPEIDAGLYYDGYHIRQRYLPDYTELFLERLALHFDR